MSFLQLIIKFFLARKREYVCIYLQIGSYTLSGAILGDRLAMLRDFVCDWGREAGNEGREVGDEGAGSGG